RVDASTIYKHLPCAMRVFTDQVFVDSTAQCRNLLRELGGARGSLASPERHGRWSVASIADAHHAGFHFANLPRVCTEQENIARVRLNRPVLIDGADQHVIRIREHAVIANFGNSSAGSSRRQSGAFTRSDFPVYR